MYLIRCTFDYYCQGWDETTGYFLVYADSFDEACDRVRNQPFNGHEKDYRDFVNCTIK